MVIFKENLTDLKEKFEKAYKLVDEESQHDPPTEPFKSHYAANSILLEMMENLKNLINSEEPNSENQYIYKVILAFIYKDLGRIYDLTEEIANGQKYLLKCLELIEEHKLKPEAVIPYLAALNELGANYSNLMDLEQSKFYLDRAESLYNDFKKTEKLPVTLMDLFGTKDEIEAGKGTKELESLYTLTTFYLAQILGHMCELEKSALYCNMTLKRQLESKEYESIDWSLNAATLSQYFLTHNRYNEARHHLAAATYVIAEHETKMITPDMSEDAKAAVTDTFRHRYADIARCWAKYGLALLSYSKDHLMADDPKDVEYEENDSDEVDDSKVQRGIENININESKLEDSGSLPALPPTATPPAAPTVFENFETLDLKLYENTISDNYALTFEDAANISQTTAKWLNRAKEYYTAETEATEYAKIISDFAELYKTLAFFDDIPANQAKLHKKRADHLEDLLKLLNPTYYLSICRECWYDCGLAYCAMLDIRLDALSQMKFDEAPTPQALFKVNSLCDKAIKHFNQYIDSYKNKDTGELSTNIQQDELQGVFYSYFHIGRLFYKIITPDKRMQLNNLRNSLKYYKKFVNDCTENEEAAKVFQAEIGVCREMVSLLPHKIDKVVSEIDDV